MGIVATRPDGCKRKLLPLPSSQALRNKRRDADKAANELEVERNALEDFAAEADSAAAEYEDNTQVRCQIHTAAGFMEAVWAELPLINVTGPRLAVEDRICADFGDNWKHASAIVLTSHRAQHTYDQQLAKCRRAKEAASAEDSTQRQQLREAEVALEAAQKVRLFLHTCTVCCPLFGGAAHVAVTSWSVVTGRLF